ncbi:4-hydroxythreonine-4-phosphate dehydrogenase PdxA [Helicobacter sp. NHP19-012]|uniref:4-hydroxythreonine-4-phosphate dehydrogenase n=1 Tax=Helicobacter gastrofelis TaxID=2849642 RepID=A0ABN6I7K7_9HELI|nr:MULTISPECIES: 4-hydroxythreonine-4-phosphate dehydrogenase [unclassified Helicobacter]BCZ19571.1 4-hydroxythreonine-4-phosphate dehydrogenase PdxA [Helicobacter sp. NHP19-012]GMB96735.1 4-hydroxythreonine-4-phosphate dehydrogenase PdxA [Helicobacter sp. NHP22-001]
MRLKIAISIGDIQGVGLEIALKAHAQISQICQPLYCVHLELLTQANTLLNHAYTKALESMQCAAPNALTPAIKPAQIDKISGFYSHASFLKALDLADNGEVSGVCTLPIHKHAWQLAGINTPGHTALLRERYQQEAIMVLGCPSLWVALFSEHIPLSVVSARVRLEPLKEFLHSLAWVLNTDEQIVVLGIDPHCGDNGAIGMQDREVKEAIEQVNTLLRMSKFLGPVPADSAFTPHFRAKHRYFVALYHDVGLAPLKALYFEESINVSLNLPIKRASVDHGVAFDIAYQNKASTKSYENALRWLSQP